MRPIGIISPTLTVVFALLIAALCLFFLIKSWLSDRPAFERIKKRHSQSEFRAGHLEAVLSSYPGIAIVWTQTPKVREGVWQTPRLMGSPATLAALQSSLNLTQGAKFADGLLSGLCELNKVHMSPDKQAGLRSAIMGLLEKGASFSACLEMPQGHKADIEGRIAQGQAILWVDDNSVRGPSEEHAISRIDRLDVHEEQDLIAFIEILNRAPFPVWRCHAQGRMVWVNPAYVKAVSAERANDVIQNQLHLHDKITEQVQTTLKEQAKHETTAHIIIHGRRRAARIVTLPVPGGAVGFALDATEAESYKETLAHHVRAHDELLNNMDEAIIIFSSAQKMTFRNRAVETIFGLPPNSIRSDLTHSQWLDHMRGARKLPEQKDYAEWKAKELALYTNWPKEMVEERWDLPDGKVLRLMRMRDASGSISLLFSDITDKMRLQRQYNTLLNVQSATLDKLNEGISVFGTDGRLKIYNSAFAKLWGLAPEKLEGEPRFDDIITDVMPLYHDKMFWRDLKGRATDPDPQIRQQVEGEIRRSDDKMISWLSKPLPDGATLMAWDDVTQERKTEAALIERAAALEAADAIKSDFVGHVSYQLRTPLTTITGYADFLQNGGAGELSDKQSEFIFAIQSASEDLGKIINDILDISAIEANVLDLELGDVDIYDLLLNSLDYVATKADDTKKTLGLNCPEDIGVIRADEKRLKQVVYNLLTNALRFTKPGGHIELGANLAASGGIELWVKDDGVGIPSERQPKVFETFQSTRGGAGLGLALVQRFIEVHGGWVDLVSDEGEGTHVTCYLPPSAPHSNSRPELDL